MATHTTILITTREFILTSPGSAGVFFGAASSGAVLLAVRIDCDNCAACGTDTPSTRTDLVYGEPYRRSGTRGADSWKPNYCGAGTWA
ncbi:MAG: hypothetical protein AB1Z65_15880 [Candidatus Sulfomarinibacteraceae bacterium]